MNLLHNPFVQQKSDAQRRENMKGDVIHLSINTASRGCKRDIDEHHESNDHERIADRNESVSTNNILNEGR